jgi:hypothetical protein
MARSSVVKVTKLEDGDTFRLHSGADTYKVIAFQAVGTDVLKLYVQVRRGGKWEKYVPLPFKRDDTVVRVA